MTFGIPCEDLLQRSKRGDTSLHHAYIRRRLEIDRRNDENKLALNTAAVVPYATISDVLIGRGRPYRDFPGNLPWNQLISEHVHRYRQSKSRFEKMCVTVDVVKLIRASNVRFVLERTSSGWKVLDDVCVREKAVVAFQNKLKTLPPMTFPASDDAAERPRFDHIL
jgi:hypothetical protein